MKKSTRSLSALTPIDGWTLTRGSWRERLSCLSGEELVIALECSKYLSLTILRGLRKLTSWFSLAWAEIYLLLGTIVERFEFQFPSTKAEDFYVTKDNFALGTPSMGVVPALVTEVSV